MSRLRRLLRHFWLDADDAFRALGEDGLQRLEARVAASEARHEGQICLCVEASLPLRYLWRHLRGGERIEDVVRDRALTTFGKQRVWDTERNNGVLIYVLLAEHEIEIVADRGLAARVEPARWRALVEALAAHFRQGRLEDGLAHAIDVVGAELGAAFPRRSSDATAAEVDDLPNRAVLR